VAGDAGERGLVRVDGGDSVDVRLGDRVDSSFLSGSSVSHVADLMRRS
jgi:hypothetical protein